MPHPKPIWPEFVDSYLETALWSTLDNDGHPFDRRHGIDDFAQQAIDQAVNECNAFIRANRKDLLAVGDKHVNGHDFWLTRNRHGAGFWDRGYPKAVANRLTKASHAAGDVTIYKDEDDERLYFA